MNTRSDIGSYPGEHGRESRELDYEKSLPQDVSKQQLERLYLLFQTLHVTTKMEAEATRFHVTVEMDKTRTELKNVIQEGDLTVIDCIKFNSAKNIQLISLIAIGTTVFSLLISFLLKINILNPFFAGLFLIASIGFYLMATVEQKRS